MNLLIDTHVLLWAAIEPAKLPPRARALLSDERNALFFSVASLWEIAIKRSLGKADFDIDPRQFRQGLLLNGYVELPIRGEHAVAVDALAPLHRDPFDRLLIVQALVDSMTLITADAQVARYAGPVRKV